MPPNFFAPCITSDDGMRACSHRKATCAAIDTAPSTIGPACNRRPASNKVVRHHQPGTTLASHDFQPCFWLSCVFQHAPGLCFGLLSWNTAFLTLLKGIQQFFISKRLLQHGQNVDLSALKIHAQAMVHFL